MDLDDEDGPEDAESEVSEVEEPTRGFRATPVLPTKAEVEAHNDMGHVVYRSWCSACRRGRGKAMPHEKVSAEEKAQEQVPTISIDYGFFNKEVDEGQASSRKDGRALPVLKIKDRRSNAVHKCAKSSFKTQ